MTPQQQEIFDRANNLVKQSRFEEAITLYLEAKGWGPAAELLERHGTEFYETGRTLELRKWLDQIDEGELGRRPRLLLLKGQVLNDCLARYSEAITLFDHAERVFDQKDDLVGVVEARIWRSVSFRMTGQGTKSLDLVNKAISQLEVLESPPQVMAWAIRNRGRSYFTVGQTSKALVNLRQSLALFEAIGDTYHIGLCHHGIGICFVKQAHFHEANHHYEKAIYIWEKLGNQNDLANTLNSLGVWHCLMGLYDEAMEKFRACFDIATKIGAVRRQAFALAGMGDVYLDRRKYKKAIDFYGQSYDLATKVGIQSLQSYTLVKAGDCLYCQEDLDKALGLAVLAEEIANKNGLEVEIGMALALQGKVYMVWQNDIELLEQILDFLDRGSAGYRSFLYN